MQCLNKFISKLYRDFAEDKKGKRFDCLSYYRKANWIQKILFTWAYPIIRKGRLSPDVIGEIPKEIMTEYHYAYLSQRWGNNKHRGNYALLRSILS